MGPVAGFDDENDQFLITDGIDDPIVAFADTVQIIFRR